MMIRVFIFVSLAAATASANPMNSLLETGVPISIGTTKTTSFESPPVKLQSDVGKSVESVSGNFPYANESSMLKSYDYALEVIRPEYPKNPRVKRWSEATWFDSNGRMIRSLRSAAFDAEERLTAFTNCSDASCVTFTRSYCQNLIQATEKVLPNFSESEKKLQECQDLSESMGKIQNDLTKRLTTDREWLDAAAFESDLGNDYASRKVKSKEKLAKHSEMLVGGLMGFQQATKLRDKIKTCLQLIPHFKPGPSIGGAKPASGAANTTR